MYKVTLNLVFSIEAEDMESAQDIVLEHILNGQICFENLSPNIQLGDVTGQIISVDKEETAQA